MKFSLLIWWCHLNWHTVNHKILAWNTRKFNLSSSRIRKLSPRVMDWLDTAQSIGTQMDCPQPSALPGVACCYRKNAGLLFTLITALYGTKPNLRCKITHCEITRLHLQDMWQNKLLTPQGPFPLSWTGVTIVPTSWEGGEDEMKYYM